MDGGFTGLDWAIVGGLLLLATLIGGPLAGKQSTIRDFFLGGRKLPWYAVCGSIIATEISAVTLISLPWVVYQPGGNLTYLQLGLVGMVLARLIVAWKLVPAYYEREIYSPYDYVGQRLGERARAMTTVLFSIGGILAQASRVFLTGLVLHVLLQEELDWLSERTGVAPLVLAIGAIGAVAILWTYVGGIATVVWTDLVLFLIFLTTAVIALVTVARELDGGFDLLWHVGRGAQKLRLWNFDTSLAEPYTFWAALFATTWLGVGALGTDQLMAQRIFCCKNVRDARLAIVASSIGLVVTVLIALVGVGLFAYYERHPLEGKALELFLENGDRIFPIFIVEVVHTGFKGLIVAGVFAAAISSLDSILAALSQTALSAFWLPWRKRRLERAGVARDDVEEGHRALGASRVLVVLFGVVLCAVAIWVERLYEQHRSILDLALALAMHTQGALLAGFLLAFLRLGVRGDGFLWSAPLSFAAVFAVAWHTPWAHRAVTVFAWAYLVAWLVLHVLPRLRDGAREGMLTRTAWLCFGVALVVWLDRYGTVRELGLVEGDVTWVARTIAWPWFVPIGCTVAFAFGVLLDTRERGVKAA